MHKLNSTVELQALDAAHHLHPFSDAAGLAREGVRVIVKGEGPYIYSSEGQRILDGMAGLWCVNIGYGRRELADAAHAQLLKLPYYNSFFKTSNEPVIELATRLARLAPEGMEHVFFGSSGSESVDTAIRLMRHYWTLMGEPERTVIIARQNAYHGSTIAGASMGGMPAMHGQLHPRLPDFEHVMAPYHYGNQLPGESVEAFGLRAARTIADRIEQVGPHRVAAIVGEPIMGAGGVKMPPANYWPEVMKIADHYGVLVLADEVITGFGRCGEWFAAPSFGIKPDLITFAKAVTSGYQPLSGVMVGGRIAEALHTKGGEFYHGYTYAGHPVACAVALANLDIIEQEQMLQHVREKAAPMLAQLLAEVQRHPLVGEVRQHGLLGAMELVADKDSRERFPGDGAAGLVCRDHFFREGLIFRAVGDTICMSPPLIWEETQFAEARSIIHKVLDLTQRDLKAA